MLVDAGAIQAVGHNLSAPGAKVIDAAGRAVMPGIVDAHCHIGMWEDGMGFEGADGNEAVNPSTPALRALDAVNPVDPCFTEAYQRRRDYRRHRPRLRQRASAVSSWP